MSSLAVTMTSAISLQHAIEKSFNWAILRGIQCKRKGIIGIGNISEAG
jgi:hypothetical protein